eukprot:4957715-Pyramimonas_sp.AAC.1
MLRRRSSSALRLMTRPVPLPQRQIGLRFSKKVQKVWSIITANVGGNVGLDAYLSESIYSDVLLLQESRMLPAASQALESKMRAAGWSASAMAALPTAGNPSGGLVTATVARVGIAPLGTFDSQIVAARAAALHVGGMMR